MTRHFHSLVADGVFVTESDGTTRFVALTPPADGEVARLVATVRRRVARLARGRGIVLDAARPGMDTQQAETDIEAALEDPFAEESPDPGEATKVGDLDRLAVGRWLHRARTVAARINLLAASIIDGEPAQVATCCRGPRKDHSKRGSESAVAERRPTCRGASVPVGWEPPRRKSRARAPAPSTLMRTMIWIVVLSLALAIRAEAVVTDVWKVLHHAIPSAEQTG